MITPTTRALRLTAWALGGLFAAVACAAPEADRTAAKPSPSPSRAVNACSLLDLEYIGQTFTQRVEPFVGTPLEEVDGKRPWGCTWGSRLSYASVEEVSQSHYISVTKDPKVRLVSQGMAQQESYGVWPDDEEEDMRFAFTVKSRYFLFDVVPSRDGDYYGFEQNSIGQGLLRVLIPSMEETL
ncbi:hypothetical protein [Streptomyces sp. NPDC019539]|uniref:hypothetical protein n=1 Tax=Streptomyces sp. NPDC019539 TaxID=3365063 RepID=UPI0037AC38EA